MQSNISIYEPAPHGAQQRPPDAPVNALVDQLLTRWRGSGAPNSALVKAARADRAFRYSHSAVRCERRWVSNLAFLAATAGTLAVIAVGVSLAEMLISTGELAVRMIVLGLLLAGCASVARRGGHRLAIQLLLVAGFIGILVLGPPDYPPLKRWDQMVAILGTALIAAKALRLFADRIVDRHEAKLLLKAAGCR